MHGVFRTLTVAATMSLAAGGASAVHIESLTGPHLWKLNAAAIQRPVLEPSKPNSSDSLFYGNETTWGIGRVSSIDDPAGSPKWSDGDHGDHLYFMFYGIADVAHLGHGGGLYDTVLSMGCSGAPPCDGNIYFDIYRTRTAFPAVTAQNPNDRLAFDQFRGLTDAPGTSLYLRLQLIPGLISTDLAVTPVNGAPDGWNDRYATMWQSIQDYVYPTVGAGGFLANVVGGSAADQWDTNGIQVRNQLQPDGTGKDVFADFNSMFTIQPNTGCTREGASSRTCFPGLINDPILSFSHDAPEPGTMALIGSALAAIGLGRRRRPRG